MLNKREGKDLMRNISYAMCALLLAALPAVAQKPAAAVPDPGCVGGKPVAPVKIEVFSDYQCPACREFFLATMRQVLSEYADAGKVCVVYREFPLTMHKYSRDAAKYGAAAMRMDQRTWALVTEAMYQNQDKWEQDGKIEPFIAAVLNKDDLARLHKEMNNPIIETIITSDIDLAKKLDVNSTPTFYVTGKGKTEKVAGAIQYPVLKRYVDYLLTP